MSLGRSNTLCLLLKAVLDRETTVELRNEAVAEGILEDVDDSMNISMKDVVLTRPNGWSACFPSLFVHGRQIRYVHIPDDIDMLQAIQEQVEIAVDQRWKKRETNTKKATVTRKLREQVIQQKAAQSET